MDVIGTAFSNFFSDAMVVLGVLGMAISGIGRLAGIVVCKD